jgi:hypothetical protein
MIIDMNQEFEPRNDLEHKLVAAMEGRADSDAFMRELLDEQVFMPVRDEVDSGIKGFQRTTRATPLVVQDDEGANVLVLFTSPERAKDFVAEFPGYGGGLLTEFRWVLERMEPGYSIVLNPGWDFGIDMEPETVAQMINVMKGSSLH